MPGFSISCLNLDEVIFSALAVGLLASSLYAVLCRDSINSILSFLFCSIILSSIVTIYCNITIGIFIAILYLSLSSVFLVINSIKSDNLHGKKKRKAITFIITALALLVSAAYFASGKPINFAKDISQYTGLTEITIIISIIFLTAISGLSLLCSNYKK